MRKTLAAALREGDVHAQPCDRCGGEGEPLLRGGKVAAWRCYPCRRLPDKAYYVYVVELARTAGEQAVYVGQSSLFPAERFAQHLTGYKAAKVVQRQGVRLRPELFERYNPIPTRTDAEAVEARLAERLAAKGFTVYGGH